MFYVEYNCLHREMQKKQHNLPGHGEMERKHTKKVIEYDSKRTEYDPAFKKKILILKTRLDWSELV